MNFATWVLAIIEVIGLAGFFLLFSSPSESQSAVLLNLSAPRLTIVLLMGVLLGLNGWILYLSAKKPKQLRQKLTSIAACFGPYALFIALSLFTSMFLYCMAGFIVFYVPFLASRMEMLTVVFHHIQSLIAWIGLSCLIIAIWIITRQKEALVQNQKLGKWYFLTAFFAVLLLVVVFGYVFSLVFSIVTFYRLIVGYYFVIIAACLLLILNWCRLAIKYDGTPRWIELQKYPRLALVFLVSFLVYKMTAIAVDNVDSPNKAYMNELAYAILDGKLYLENPSSTLDLTLFQGKWYVAFPPLATILMLPLAWIFGNNGVNTVTFSIFFSSVNAVLVYEMLTVLSERGWTKLKRKDNLWLLLLFVLGTIHWSMAVDGKVWYINRILALTFMLLATVLTLKRRSPWLIGLAIALSIGARPNMVFIWPFLLGIYWQGLRDDHSLSLRKLVEWTVKNAIPIAFGVFALLFYNWLRFDNWLDFGYLTMNVGPNAAIIREYGQFNLRFIPWNLYYMWLSLPHIRESCLNLLVPDVQGISIILTTPPVVYIVKAFRRSPWVIGAWAALLLQIVLLSTHTGTAFEFGYRFFMDFVIPVMALIAVGAGSRVSWVLKVLILAGVVVNLWGVLWVHDIWCPV